MSENTNTPRDTEPHPHDESAADTGSKALSEALKISFGFLKVAMIILIVVYILSGLFVVGPDEVKIRLTFGRPAYNAERKVVVLDSNSGWHIKWPWQELVTVSGTDQEIELKQAFWFKQTPAMPGQEETPPEEEQGAPEQPGGGLAPVNDRYLITGDANIVHMKLTAKYRVAMDLAADYAFEVGDPAKTLKTIVEAATVDVVGRLKVDDVLTRSRGLIVEEVLRETRKRLRDFQETSGHSLGVRLTGVTLNDLIVPKTVRGAFDQADAARNEFYTKKRQAEAKEREILRNADGESVKTLSEAESARTRLVSSARADAKRIKDLSAMYTLHPRTFRQNYYRDRVTEVLGKAKQVWVLHTTDPGSRREVRLLVNPRPEVERKQTPGQPGQPPH